MDKGYAADVTATEAYALLKSRADSVLVDVRTEAEWSYVGVPDLSGLGRDAPILFLCRSGARSEAAARRMTELGFSNCLNVAGGFEGPLYAARHRGSGDGWKAQALPWRQT